MQQFLTAVVCLIIPGVFLISSSLNEIIRGQGHKGLYMVDNIYLGRVYAGIPAGLGLIILALIGSFRASDISLLIIVVTFSFGGLSLVAAITQPSILKPTWLKWLEQEHGEIMPLLRQEVAEMGHSAWNKQMKTQADMEVWVADVRAKHGL